MGDVIDFKTKRVIHRDKIKVESNVIPIDPIFTELINEHVYIVYFTAPNGSLSMDRNDSNLDISMEMWTDKSNGQKLGIAHVVAHNEKHAAARLISMINVKSIDKVERQ